MSDYLASLNEKLQKAQAHSTATLLKASAKNPELNNNPTPNHTPVSAYNMGAIDMSSSDLQQRTDVINAKSNTERGFQEYANDAGVAGLQALHGMSESMVTLGSALVGAPAASAYNLAMGKPTQSTGQFIDSALTNLGYRDTAAALKAWESPQLQEIRKEGYAIDNNPNMTESEKYKAKVKYWASNPATTLTDSASMLARSLGETYLFGGMGGKLLGLESKVGKVALGSGVPGSTGYISDVLNDPRNTDKELSIPNAVMAGAGTALIGGAFAKYSPLDFDKAFVGGGTGVLPRVPSSTLVRAAGGGANEAAEETLQGSALHVLKEYELTGELSNKGLGSAAADSTVLGFGSGGLMGTIAGAPQDVQTINNNVVDVLAASAEKRRIKREGTTEEQLDMTSPKSNPTKVFKQALYDLKSDDPEVREFSANLIARSTNVVTAHKEALEEDISKATTDEEKEAAIQALNDFRTKSYDPLQAEIKLYINSKGSKKNLLSSATEIVERQRAAAAKVLQDRETKTARVNVNELVQQLGSSTNTTSTSTTNTANKKSNIASLIQRGESGAKSHAAVNYGQGNKNTNIDPTTMTVGAISNGLSNGEFVAVGKYQMHKSSFDEMRQSLSWVNENTKFTPEVQDRIFAEYYIGKKRKDLAGYITGENNNLKQANDEFAREWAAAEGSNGKGMYGGNNKATIKSSEVQTHLQEAREIYKALVDKGASPESALRTAVMFDLDESPSVSNSGSTPTTTRDPSTYIKYTNQQAKRNEPLDPKVSNALGFLADMGVTFEINSGGQSDTSRGKVGSTAHNHGNAGDGILKYNGKALDWDNPQDKAMLEKIVEEAAANGINGIGAGYMGKGRVHFGIQNKAATWGNGKDANSPAFDWVAAAHARGLKRKPTTTQVSVSQEETKASNQATEDNSDIDALQKMLADLDEAEKAEVTANDPTLEEDKKRLARIAAAKGDIDSNIAKVLYSTEQVEALRKVDKLKADLASKNNLSDTQNEIVNGKKSKSNNPLESTLGLKDYDEIFAAALATNDTKTVNLNLAYLERFNENHQSKNALIQKILSQPIPDGGVKIAANASGKWIEVSDKQLKDLEAFKGSKPLTIVGDNRLTQSIAEEAEWISSSLSNWSDLTSQLMEGVTPIKLTPTSPSASSYSNATSTPPVSPTTPPVVPTSTTSTTPPPTATVPQTFTPVNNISEVKSDGFYLGRGKDSNGETISISSLDPNLKGGEMNVGKPGWLGDGGTQTKTIDDYIGKFKTYANEYESFVPQLIEDLSKPLYAYKKPKADSETNFLLSLASEIKGKSKVEVASIIESIESYSYKDGLKLSAPTSVTPTETQGLPDRKVRSSIDAKGTKLGVAPDAMKPTKAPNELNNKSAVGIDEYTNQYTHTEIRKDGNEELWQVLINRNASTNMIEDISVIQGDRDVEVFEAPNTSWSDEATIDWLQKEGFELPGNYKQAAYNNESIELPKMEMDYIDKVSIPKEIKNKAIKVSDMTEKYKGAIDSKNIEEKEVALYTGITEPLLNFNPDLKVRISSDLGDNRYDSKTNTIHINPKNKGHIVSETARLVIETSTKDLAKKLEDNSYDKLDAKNEDLVKLNKELTYVKQIINRNGLLENDSKLSIPLRKKLLEALSSNSKLLSMSLTDSEIMTHLQGISYNLDDKKPKNSVFNKIVSAVRTFFNIGNNNEVANMFDKMVELTARTAQIQAMNKDVSFKPSVEGKAHIFQNLIEADSILEMEKSYYSRNNLLAKFKQVTAKSKPLSGIANLASKLKMDLMQGVNALTSISPNRAQREQLEDFLQFRDEFSIHLMDTFAQKKVTYKVDGVKKAMSLEEFTKYEEDNGKVAADKLTVNDFSSQDLKSNLMDADGNIDENTLTAAAIAAYDFFIEYGNRTTNRDKDIRKLLNLDDDSTNYIPSKIQEDYVDGVMLKNVQGHSLGKKVTDLMNIKSNGLGSIEVASELDSSIGEWVVSAMQSADLIHIRSMPTKDHYSNIAEVGGELTDEQKKVIEDGSKGEVTFISVVDKNSKNRNPRLQEIVDASKGTLGYMGNVFGSEVGLIAPTLLSTDEMIDKIRGTTATTSKEQLDMMHTMQQEPMRVNSKAYDAMMTVLDKFRSETLLMMKADVTEEQLAAEHVSDRHSIKSSADGLLRELSTMTDFVGTLKKDNTGKREAFYDSIYGAKNNRMHYSANMINFQLSKIHRAMVDYENFEADVDITGLDTQNWYNEDGTTSELGFVMRGIMEQAEGTEKLMKSALEGSAFTQGFTVDKLPSEAVLDHFYKYVTTDEQVTKAVASMDKLLNQSNKFTSEDMSNITELVEFWEGDLGSFRVLMELTNLLNAHKNGDKTLTTSIGVGSDGVNNGIAISTIQMGVASDRFLAQVGIIPEGEEYAQVNGYYDTRKIKDLGDYYEGFKSIMEPYIKSLATVSPALIKLNTSLSSRKFMKAILIPFGYSAGDKRLHQVAFSQLLEDIKGTMKEIAAMDENDQTTKDKLKEFEDNLSAAIGTKIELPKGKALLEYWFTSKEIQGLMEEHETGLANIIDVSIKEYAGTFIEERNRNVKIQNGNSEAYLVVRKTIEAKAKQAYKESLKNSDTYKGMTDAQLDKLISLEGMPTQFYMENVESILKEVRPTVRTPFNVNSEDKASDFNAMQDTKTLKSNEGSVASNKRVSDGNLYSTNTELAVIRMLEESVGITVSSAQVQGVDAFIAAWASAKADAVNRNIHDQGDSGVRNFVSMGKAQNQATFEALKIYHVQLESLASLGRTLDAINSMVSDGVIDTATYAEAVIAAATPLMSKKDINKAMKEAGLTDKSDKKELVTKIYAPILEGITYAVSNAEGKKLEILKRMRVVQQYAGENGEYIPTQADRDSVDLEYAKIDAKIKKVMTTIESTKGVKSSSSKSTSSDKVNNFVSLFDTKEVYEKWSNTRDGTDLKAMQDQILDIANTYAPLITEENKEEVMKELLKFKWFKSVDAKTREKALNMLIGDVSANTSSKSQNMGAENKQTYELSNIGDRRFSDTSATMGDGKNLRQLYNQEVRNRKLTKSEDKYQVYKRLWKQYLMVYGTGYETLKQLKADGYQFTDNFAKDGISAARAVNELIDEGIGDYTNITDVGTYIKELMDNSAKEGNPITDIQTKLYQYIYRAYKDVNPNMTFSLNNEDTVANRNGVHFADINHVTLFTKSFSNSEATLQILMHEMAHGITVNKMKHTTDPVVIAAHNELENMRLELLSKATDSFTKDFVLENVYELIAYGLTDGVHAKFIADNLTETYNVPVNNKGEAYGLKYGLRLFLDKVKQFFYGDKVTKGADNFDKFIRLIDLTVVKLTEEELKKSRSINVPLGNYATVNPLDTLKSMSNGNASPEHVSHLDSIISSTVSDTLGRDPTTVTDIIDSVSKKAISAGFKLSDKELYTMEIVKATINEYLNTSSGAKTVSELRKVFARVTDKLTYESFLTDPTNATQSQIAIAKRKYQYIKFPRGADKDAHVERVISLLVTSEEFRQVADKVTNKSLSEREGTWFDSLMAYLENIFNAMTGKVLGISNLSNSKQADQLINRIQIIHNNGLNHQKHKLDVMYEESLKVLTTPLNWTTNKIVDGIFKGIEYSGSKFSQDSTVGSILRATTKVRKTGINEYGETVIRESALLNDNPSNRLNALGEVVNELVRTKGMKATVEEQLRATNKIGQDRDTIKKSTIKILANAFSRELTSEESNSITQQLLRPDMSSLLFNGYNVTRVMKLLRNQKERHKEVAKLEAKILNNPNGNDILIQTKSLALYMAKEESVDHVVKNAENVAIGKDSWYEVPMENMNVDLRNDIDVLASLYAFDYTDNSSRKTFLEILASEEEGVKAFLQTHKEMIKLAKEDFKDNPYSYIKGFTPQLTNPLKSLMFAETAEDIKALENEGWVKVSDGDLKQDPTDTSSPRTLMYHNDMLYQDYISGALDMKDTHAKGTNVYDLSTLKDLKRVEQAKRNKRRSRNASMSYMNYDPRKVKGNSLIANYDSEGSVINYSYEMSGEVRDSYLERNNNAFEMVGILNSDAHFKPAIAESQRNVANALFTDYEDNYLSDPRQYIVLDPNSPDPDVAMKWKMMPYAFKAEATKLFGKGNPIVVRTNVYNAVFGFRAYSLSEIFDPKHKKDSLQGIVATVLTAAMGEKAKMRVIQAERLYQAGIDKMKNFIVIRNHAVLAGNIIANSLLLSLHGVSPVQQVKDMISVWRNGGDYRKAATRIAEIDVELSINQSRPKIVSSLKRERNILNKALEQNPMHMFMKAGLMSTIVEDVGMDTEDTGFRSDLEKKVDEVAEYIPEQVRTAFNWAIMSPGTPLHEFMKHATQFSDLAAKYSLATQRMREGASMKESITEAQDNFINYDVPTGRGMDYMNRMGFFMFTKFFIRFQQVLLNRLHYKAGSTIGQHILVEQLGFSGVLDPLAVTRIGNVPFQSGILGYDEAFKNISTVSLIPGI